MIENLSGTAVADRLYEAYLKKDYLEYYPWFDQIIQERDVVQIERLDQAVLNLIKENNSEDVWLAIPEIISWENQKGFSYKRYRKTNNPHKPGPVVVTDLNLEAWAQNINLNTLTIKTLKNNHIFSIGLDDSIIQATSVYSCLNAEIARIGRISFA